MGYMSFVTRPLVNGWRRNACTWSPADRLPINGARRAMHILALLVLHCRRAMHVLIFLTLRSTGRGAQYMSLRFVLTLRLTWHMAKLSPFLRNTSREWLLRSVLDQVSHFAQSLRCDEKALDPGLLIALRCVRLAHGGSHTFKTV
jgi:hypothetical protein